MINIDLWMQNFLKALNACFSERVWFVGLQGSYGRGEATMYSDIDTVVILDELTAQDVDTYKKMLDKLAHRDMVCGFLSGKEELLHWDASDLFQFYHDTKPVQGSLDELLSFIDENAVNKAIKTGACNIYHSCVHNMLHSKSRDMLKGQYKSASFLVQAIAFKQTGKYILHQADLLQAVAPQEQEIIKTFLHLKNGGAVDFAPMAEALFTWSKKWIVQTR